MGGNPSRRSFGIGCIKRTMGDFVFNTFELLRKYGDELDYLIKISPSNNSELGTGI